MPQNNSFSAMVGSGNVGVSTFVQWQTANPASPASGAGVNVVGPGYYVNQCVVGEIPCGVAQMGSRYAPTDENNANIGFAGQYLGLAGQAGDPIAIFGLGDTCQLQIGTTVTAGQLLMPNASGQGIPAVSGNFYGAEAQESGTAGALIRVQVKQGRY